MSKWMIKWLSVLNSSQLIVWRTVPANSCSFLFSLLPVICWLVLGGKCWLTIWTSKHETRWKDLKQPWRALFPSNQSSVSVFLLKWKRQSFCSAVSFSHLQWWDSAFLSQDVLVQFYIGIVMNVALMDPLTLYKPIILIKQLFITFCHHEWMFVFL